MSTPNNFFMLVDDDADDTGLFTEALNAVKPDTVCYTAKNGIDALQKLGNVAVIPDMIFLDLNMPGMNGWECLKKLKTDVNLKEIPVIIHTTSSRKTDREVAKELGALCFFTKTTEFKQLKQMLRIVVEHIEQGDVDSVCEAVNKQINMFN